MIKTQIRLVALSLIAGSLFGCSDNSDQPTIEPKDVYLELNVVAPNNMQNIDPAKKSPTRAYEDKVDGELIKTLRFIIVRPDGTVEHNRLYDFNPIEIDGFEKKFKVASGEQKRVFVVANEDTRYSGGAKVVNYDFDRILPGQQFPMAEFSAIEITTSTDTQTLPTPLVMCFSKRFDVPVNSDLEGEMEIIPAATKFTFTVTNNSAVLRQTVKSISINKIARREYLWPRTSTGDDVELGLDGNMIEYVVPSIANNEYYTFTHEFGSGTPIELAPGGSYTDTSFYLTEGKFTDAGDLRNYSITFNYNNGEEITSTQYFPNLAQLPRNSHVVCNISIGETVDDVAFSISVVAFGSVELNPGFGF
ncbi:MAG: hypothetical protein PUC77_10015 [Bacteroidales bacterium]|nr:hypothetical protein [Bacteroidales bacterium]MDD6140633.1 hypothetical protein [Bacteroidales bacterium]MDD6621466.1 hypothetical protein [Bacteroidales bacterium]MDD6668676.1 hypothetical protein [Bacteroidales bacterium]